MANYVIENVDPLAPKSVCIYVVSPDGTLVPKDITQFTNLDAFGKGLGINLLRGYNVSCVGAYPFAGAIEVVAKEGGLNSPITVINSTDKVSTYNNTEELINGLTNEWDIKTTQISPFRSNSETNDRIFMLNGKNTNTDIMAIANDQSSFENVGPNGAIVVSKGGKQLSVCLSPSDEVTIPERIGSEASGLGLEDGEWVVEIDGEIVPHYFTADQLPIFFGEDNKSGYGVSFSVAVIPPTVKIEDFVLPELNGVVQLKYTYDGTDAIESVHWESTDTLVATVNQTGLLKLVGAGTCKIKVVINGKTQDSVEITYAAPPSNVINVTTTAGTILYSGNIGDIFELSDGTTRPINKNGNYTNFAVPAGTHKLILSENSQSQYPVGLAGSVVVGIDRFPTFEKTTGFSFSVIESVGCSNLKDVPSYLPPNITNISNMFNSCSEYDGVAPVTWDVSHVTRMDNFDQNASNFNPDLSKWCVTNITTKPIGFGEYSGLVPQHYPIWGTCPSG